MLAGRAGRLRRLPRLRRGRAPLRHRAVRRPGGAAQHRPADRPAAPRRRSSPRGRYHLVVLSDHGQTQGEAFADRFGESVEELVGAAVRRRPGRTGCGTCRADGSRRPTEGWQVGAALAEAQRAGPVARRLRGRVAARRRRHPRARRRRARRRDPGGARAWCARSPATRRWCRSPSMPGRVELEEIERRWPDLLPGLVDHAGVGFLLVHSEEFGPVVLGRDGAAPAGTGVVIGEDPLLPLRPARRRAGGPASTFPHCADVVINSRLRPRHRRGVGVRAARRLARRAGRAAAARVPAPPRRAARPGEIVGAEHLHRVLRGWLTDLGHPEPTGDRPGGPPRRLSPQSGAGRLPPRPRPLRRTRRARARGAARSARRRKRSRG